MVSADAYEKGQAFLSLNSHAPVKNAIGNKPLERFNGSYWDKIHITTTFTVRSGDIVLIRRVGIDSCPGLKEQIASSYAARPGNDVSSNSGSSISGYVWPPPLSFPLINLASNSRSHAGKLSKGKRKRTSDDLVDENMKRRMIDGGATFIDVIDISLDSD
jgi:hypothetical protein